MVQSIILTVLALFATVSQHSLAFVPCSRSLTHHALYSTKTKNAEAQAPPEPEESTSMTTLNLIGEVTKTSAPAPAPNGKELLQFFSLPDSAPLILRGSKNNHIVEITDPDYNLLQMYDEQCRRVNAHSPRSDHKLYDVTTSAVKFPGLNVMTVATVGVNIVTCEKGLPTYQFVLVKDSTFAEGNRIFVWFFNKVTGKDKNKDNEEATTESLNTIRVVYTEENEVAFEANASLRIQVKFPSFLLKVLPGGKEKSELTGGESLRRVLEEDLPVALDGFRQEYIRWIES